MHGGLQSVVVDDANGVLLHGLTDHQCNDAGEAKVWVFADKASGFGIDVGQVQLHDLKKNEQGHYVA